MLTLLLLAACSADRWVVLTPMEVAREGHSATLLTDGRVVVIGGQGGSGETMRSTALYDPSSDTWASGPPMPDARAFHSATLLPDGRVLVAGGAVGSVPIRTVHVLDAAGEGWTEGAPLSRGRDHHTATLLGDGAVVVVGGFVDPLAPGPERWDPGTETWTEWDVPLQRTDHVALAVRDGLLIAGGRDSNEQTASALTSTGLLNLSDGSFTPSGDLVAPRTGLGGATAGEGAFVFGGATSNSGAEASILPSVERWDGQGWEGFGTLAAARTRPTVVALGEGAVAVFGGSVGDGLRASPAVEVVDPVIPQLQPGADMPDGRLNPAAVRLTSGEVMLFGGSDGVYIHAETWGWTPPKGWR